MLASTMAPARRDRWFAGTFLRIIADCADTGGAFTVMEQRARRGFSPPLHVHHHEDTAILVLDGDLTVAIDGVEQTVSAGGFVWLPRDRAHSFRVESAEAHILEFATPGGVEGFHLDASDAAESVTLPPAGEADVPRMLAAVSSYGIEILGPPMT